MVLDRRAVDHQRITETAATIADSLALFLSPDDVVEIRAFDVQRPGRVMAGFVRASKLRDRARDIARIAEQAAGGCYFTPQQIDPTVFDRTKNLIVETKKRKGETFPRLTHDVDVTARRFLMIDVDPVRAGTGDERSSTDAEKAAGRCVADAIISDLTASGWPAPLVIDSGNGWHLYYRMAIPFRGGEAVSQLDTYWQFLSLLSDEFGTDEVKIDPKVYNASRIMRLPGTVNRKGTHTEQYPHRRAAVVVTPAEWKDAVVSSEQFSAKVEALDPGGEKRRQWERGTIQQEPKPTRVSVSVGGAHSVTRGLELSLQEKINIAKNYLASVPGAIEKKFGGIGTAEDDTLWACRVATLGCDLDQETALAVLTSDWNTRCQGPWDERGLRHKVQDAATLPFGKPRGWIIEEHLNRKMEATNKAEIATQLMNGTAPAPTSSNKASEIPNGLLRCEGEAENDPHYLARAFLARRFQRGALVFWRSDFYQWKAGAYCKVPTDEMNAAVNKTVHHHLQEMHKQFPKKPKEGQEPPTIPRVTNTLVGDVIGALKGMCVLKSETTAPAWINHATGHDPRHLIAANNGLVHLPTYAVGGPDAIGELTPDFFNLNALPYKVSPTAPEPVEWLKFLDSIWPNDPESVQLLQEWFGYLLTRDNSQQKMLLLFGPKRAGKTTILGVLKKLVGDGNYAAPTLSLLCGEFGISELTGKTMAVIEDARLNSHKLDITVGLERLLTISGNGEVPVNKKNRDIVTTKLDVRFVVATNKLIDFKDGPLASRWCPIRLTKTFYDKEDPTLPDRLAPEISGIFNWAVEGWKRLQQSKRFTQPASSVALARSLAETGSVVGDFVEDCCVLGKHEKTTEGELFKAWDDFCKLVEKESGSKKAFLDELIELYDGVSRKRARIDRQRVYEVHGIALKVEGQRSIDYGDNREDADLLELDTKKVEDL